MLTKEELAIKMMVQSMSNANGLDSVPEEELRIVVRKAAAIHLIVAEEILKIVYPEGN